jgi:hypothetical protein
MVLGLRVNLFLNLDSLFLDGPDLERNLPNLNFILRSVYTPLLISRVCSKFSAEERNTARQGEIGEYQLSKAFFAS